MGKRTRPGDEFPYETVVSQLLTVEYLSLDLDFSCSFFCIAGVPGPLPYFVLLLVYELFVWAANVESL